MALSKFGERLKKMIGRKVRIEQLPNGFFRITIRKQYTDIHYWKITQFEEDKEGEIFRVEYHERVSHPPPVMACLSREWYRVAAVASVEEV